MFQYYLDISCNVSQKPRRAGSFNVYIFYIIGTYFIEMHAVKLKFLSNKFQGTRNFK